MSAADLAAVVDNNRGGDFGGNGAWWLIILFLFAFAGNGWGGGYGGGGYAPWMMAGQVNTNNDVQRGFDQSALMGGLNGINASVNGINQALCNGFAGVNATVNGGFANAETAATARQIANMQQAFNTQTAITGGLTNLSSQFANCCCENRLGLANLNSTILAENCADRAVLSDGIRDVLAATQAQTQTILDKLCQQEIDALKTQNANLQTQVNLANLQASQTAQTARILADNAAQTTAIEQYLNPAPVPAYVVQNPNGCGFGCA
jgi:hypothetical protein